MANKFPKKQYGHFEKGETFMAVLDSVEDIVDDRNINVGETVTIAVYELKEVIKVKKESKYTKVK